MARRPAIGTYERRLADPDDEYSDRVVYTRIDEYIAKKFRISFREGEGSVLCFDGNGRPCDVVSISSEARQHIIERRKTPRQPPEPYEWGEQK